MQKILNKKITKIIISIILSLGVLLCGFIEVFADDLSTLPSGSSDPEGSSNISTDVPIPDEALVDASEQLLELLKTNELTADRAIEYTTTDIYRLLINVLCNGTSSTPVYSGLYLMQRYLLAIANAMTDNSPNSTPTTGNTVYALLYDVHDILYSIESQFHLNELSDLTSYANYSMYDYLILAVEAVSEVNAYLPNLIPNDYTSQLTTIINSISSTNTKLNSLSSYVNSIDNQLKKYSWTSFINNETPIFVGYTSDFENLITTNQTYRSPFYAWFSGMPVDYYNNYIVSIEIPVQKNLISSYIYTPDVKLYIRYQSSLFEIKHTQYIVIPNRSSFTIYAILPMFSTSDEFIIGFTNISNSNTVFINTPDPTVLFLKDDTKDYWEFYDRIIKKHMTDNIDKLTSVYASDDLIAAKEAQQPYEQQAIDDFTGSGSAASSTSDLGNLKSTSGAFKSGLSTSRSASDALSVFSSSSELWSWFSINTLNDLDHTSQYNTRNMLKSGSNEDQIIDFYNMNNQGLIDWMHP